MVQLVHPHLTPLYSTIPRVPTLTHLLVHLGTPPISKLGSSMSIEVVGVPQHIPRAVIRRTRKIFSNLILKIFML